MAQNSFFLAPRSSSGFLTTSPPGGRFLTRFLQSIKAVVVFRNFTSHFYDRENVANQSINQSLGNKITNKWGRSDLFRLVIWSKNKNFGFLLVNCRDLGIKSLKKNQFLKIETDHYFLFVDSFTIDWSLWIYN